MATGTKGAVVAAEAPPETTVEHRREDGHVTEGRGIRGFVDGGWSRMS